MRKGVSSAIVMAFLVTLTSYCWADTNALEDAIYSFPDPAGYRPDEAVRSANLLIAAGEAAASHALSEAAAAEFLPPGPVNEKALLLCRLLFTAKNSARPIWPPHDGGVLPVEHPADYQNTTQFPFVITNGIPFLLPRITRIGSLINGPEAAWHYVEACQLLGKFRTEPFPIVTLSSTSNALIQILASPEWRTLQWTIAPSNYPKYFPASEAQLVSADWGAKRMRQQVNRMKRPAERPSIRRVDPDPL